MYSRKHDLQTSSPQKKRARRYGTHFDTKSSGLSRGYPLTCWKKMKLVVDSGVERNRAMTISVDSS